MDVSRKILDEDSSLALFDVDTRNVQGYRFRAHSTDAAVTLRSLIRRDLYPCHSAACHSASAGMEFSRRGLSNIEESYDWFATQVLCGSSRATADYGMSAIVEARLAP